MNSTQYKDVNTSPAKDGPCKQPHDRRYSNSTIVSAKNPTIVSTMALDTGVISYLPSPWDRADANRLQPPELEKQLYYQGLPSRPQLVARSNFSVSWQPEFEDEHPKLKYISNVGSHDILNKYDTALREKIITRLGSTEWTSIDVVRIGYSGSHADPVILWIGVAPGSLASQTGLEIALGCRSELMHAGLNVHCEIREATVESLAAVSVIPHQDAEGADRPISLTSVLGGQSIASEETSAKEGTLSLYLSLGESASRINCALISRHVVFKDDNRRYLHHNNLAEHVIMPGQTTFDEICTEGNEHAAFWQSQGNKYKAQSDVTNQLNAHLSSLKDTASRRIGHVLFSPPRLPQYHQDSLDLWLPDYALVLLDRDRFGPDYEGLSNTLWVGQPAYDDVKKMNRGKPFEAWKPASKQMQLHGTFTAGDTQGSQPIFVGKRGRTTGLS